ncbi:MAG: alpha-amylase family glycosyl hydrolase, partial [Acidimicrobiia bacterium]
MSATVQLIAYADRFGSDLAGLESLLQGPLDGLFGGVHILPFFSPIDGADAGFDPDDHTVVDPRLGTWGDIASVSSSVEVMADLIVNHVSARSHQAVDWQEHGDESPYKSMFLTMDGVFGPHPSDDDLGAIYRPRPGVPFTTMAIGEESRSVWTTFSSEQLDLNVADAMTREYLCS